MKPSLISAGKAVALLLTVSGLALAGCASETPAPVAQVAEAPPPPPPVTLSTHVLEAASNFRGYMRKAQAISARFSGGQQVEQSLVLGEQYEPQQLSRGAIAYAALVALQQPDFVAGIRTYAASPAGRRDLAARLNADPAYVSVLPGAGLAAGLVVATLNAEGTKVRGVGEMVKQSAYEVQHQAWSKVPVPNADLRLAAAKSASSGLMTPIPADVQEFKLAVSGADASNLRIATVPGGPVAAPFTPVVARGLTLAALAALGAVGEGDDIAADALMTESQHGFCLKMSKLNLYQCLAVAKPYYEDVFCLGQHVLIDTGTCVASAVGTPQPAGPTPVSLAAQASGTTPLGAAAQLGMAR